MSRRSLTYKKNLLQDEGDAPATFAVTGRLKTFASRDELRECLEACGAALTEMVDRKIYLIEAVLDPSLRALCAAVVKSYGHIETVKKVV